MPYYLAPHVGAGTFFDPFRPRAKDAQPGATAIDLGLAVRRAFLHLPVHDTDPLLERLADNPTEILATGQRNRLGNLLGLTLAASQWNLIVAELLMTHGRTDGTRWGVLRPSVVRQRYEIWLGGLLFAQPLIAGGSSVLDSFDRADADLDGSTTSDGQSTWTEFSATQWTISSNTAAYDAVGSGPAYARVNFDLATDDFYVQATLSTFSATSGNYQIGLLGRKDSTATITEYEWRAQEIAGGLSFELLRANAGIYTSLDTSAQDPVVNDVLRLIMDGNTYEGRVNGIALVGPSTDGSPITDNLRGGIFLYNDVGNAMALNDWSAANLAAGGGVAQAPNRNIQINYGGTFAGAGRGAFRRHPRPDRSGWPLLRRAG